MKLIKKLTLLLTAFVSLTSCTVNINISNSTSVKDSDTTTTTTEENNTTTSIVEPTTSSSSTIDSSSSNEAAYDNTLYNGYYSSIDFSLRDAALKTALATLINPHTDIGYDGCKTAYKDTDLREDGKIWDMYSNCDFEFTTDMSGNYQQEGDMYNREHTIPQSIFSKASPMKSDLFHVYHTDGYVNNRRSNFPHAEVSSASYTSSNNTLVGTSATEGVSGTVCEPADEYKGDFARTYFYFVTCYETKMSSFQTYACFSKNSYPSLAKWAIKLYVKWAEEDPVSEKEANRNQAVFGYQNNRNPFIDYPGLEKIIWSSYI